MFSIIIIGGENVPNYKTFQDKCVQLLRNKAESGERIRILSIGDEYVNKFASTFGIETKVFTCDWRKHGKDALAIRNKSILSEANAILYFNSGKKDLTSLYEYASKFEINRRNINIEQLPNP
jgi:hypothetical protein